LLFIPDHIKDQKKTGQKSAAEFAESADKADQICEDSRESRDSLIH
jgi:hypothetical protein